MEKYLSVDSKPEIFIINDAWSFSYKNETGEFIGHISDEIRISWTVDLDVEVYINGNRFVFSRKASKEVCRAIVGFSAGHDDYAYGKIELVRHYITQELQFEWSLEAQVFTSTSNKLVFKARFDDGVEIQVGSLIFGSRDFSCVKSFLSVIEN